MKIVLFGGDPEVHEIFNDYAKIENDNPSLIKNC